MRVEITSRLSPETVLEATKGFFTGPNAYASAWLETESESHLGFGTFRGNLAVAAFPDPEGEARTRIRISTLREEGVVPRLLTYLRTLATSRPASPSPASLAGGERGEA